MTGFEKIIIVVGHYGCGKTNFAVNLALDIAASGEKTTLFDLDIVNPYFRSADHKEMLEQKGIELVAPLFAGSNVDAPALPAAMYSMTEREGTVIVDVGGDDAGAVALGRYARQIANRPYTMLCVINKYRALSTEPEETAELLADIEEASRLKATALVNNSHLMGGTTAQTVLDSLPYAEECSRLTGLPVALNCVRRGLLPELEGRVENIFPVDIFVRTPWQNDI